VKKCVSCTKDLPDTAMHCVFCGAKQPAVAAPAAAKTVMGYQAADLLKNLPKPPAAAAAPPHGPPPHAQPSHGPPSHGPPPHAPPSHGPPPHAPPPHGPPPHAPPPASPEAMGTAATAFLERSPLAAGPPGPGGPPMGAPGFGATMPAPAGMGATMPAPAGPPSPHHGGPPRPGMGAPPHGMGAPPHGMGAPPHGMGAPPHGMGAPPHGMGAPPHGMGAPPHGMGAPPHGMGAPPVSPAQASTVFMDAGPRPPMPAPAPGPAHFAPPPAAAPFAPPPAAAPFAPPPAPAPYAPPPMAGPGSSPYHPPAAPAAMPPYLASQTAARLGHPVDPYARGLQLVMIVFGALLLAAFVTPLTTKPGTSFWWDLLSADGVPAKAKLVPVLMAATGLLGVILGLIPLASTGRAAAAAALGTVAILYPATVLNDPFTWQVLVFALGAILLPTGLLLRDAYRDAGLGRILATVGVVCVLLFYLVPIGDKPLLMLFLDGLADAPGKGKIAPITGLVPLLLALISLVVWLPGPGAAGA
jgi:hypothetical protein